jgi:hypothetical protein
MLILLLQNISYESFLYGSKVLCTAGLGDSLPGNRRPVNVSPSFSVNDNC